MTFIPFPPTLVAISAEAARKRNHSRKKPLSNFPKYHTFENVAAYQAEDGSVHPAYSPFEPEYPRGTTPGLASILYTERFYPNETRGYDSSILKFEDIHALKEKGLEIDTTAAAIVMKDDIMSVLVGSSDSDLEEQISLIHAGHVVKRAPIKSSINNQGPLTHFCATHAAAGIELHAGSSEGELNALLKNRYGFMLDKSETLSETLDSLVSKSQNLNTNWNVAYTERDVHVELGFSM